MSHPPDTLPPPKQRRLPPRKPRVHHWATDVYASVMTTISRHRPSGARPPSPKHKQVPEQHEEEEPAHAPGFLEYCWPAIFGILLAIISGHLRQKVIHDWGDVGDRLVFPYVQLAGRPEFGFSEEMSNSLPQIVLLLQFPIYGFYASISLARRHKLATVVLQILFVSLIASFVLWLLSKPGASHGL